MHDRLDALMIFVAVAEQQSFTDAARRLNRSPASVTRAVAALEERLQTRLFNRTTRSVALTDAGERYLDGCRRLLATYDELEAVNFGERIQPRGWINVTAPVMFGQLHVLPLVQSFLDEHPQVDVRLLLLDRMVSLVDEGLDLGVRIGHLPDSSLLAVRVGRVRRIVCGTPQYISRYGMPAIPHDLSEHRVVACTSVTPIPNRWSFHGPSGVISVNVTPRLVVNTTAAAVAAGLNDSGLICVLSYQAGPTRPKDDSRPSSSTTNHRPRPFTSSIRKAGTFRPKSACFSTTSPKDFVANLVRRSKSVDLRADVKGGCRHLRTTTEKGLEAKLHEPSCMNLFCKCRAPTTLGRRAIWVSEPRGAGRAAFVTGGSARLSGSARFAFA
jgi:DNA-binding transcriptional LysR family regulator